MFRQRTIVLGGKFQLQMENDSGGSEFQTENDSDGLQIEIRVAGFRWRTTVVGSELETEDDSVLQMEMTVMGF